MIYRTEDLLSSIKTRTLAPIAQTTFTDADLIMLLNEEQLNSCVPDIMMARENFFLRSVVTAIEANNPIIPIPERAIGGAAKEVFYISGSEATNRWPLPQKKISDLAYGANLGDPQGFYVKDNALVIWPTPSSAVYSVEVWFYARPNDLVLTTACGEIDTITTGVSEVTFILDTDISATLAVGSKVDIVSAKSPNRIQVYDAVIQSITGVNVTLLLADCVDGGGGVIPELGDYLCPAGESPIPLIPVEYHPVLCQMVAARLVEALGDMTKIQMVNAKLSEMRKQSLSLITNRVESDTLPIVNRRGIRSHLSSGCSWRGRG